MLQKLRRAVAALPNPADEYFRLNEPGTRILLDFCEFALGPVPPPTITLATIDRAAVPVHSCNLLELSFHVFRSSVFLAGGNVEYLEFIGNFAISKQNEIPSTLAKIRGIAIR
jgi:hypothetical protein